MKICGGRERNKGGPGRLKNKERLKKRRNNMALKVRRVVVANNARGISAVVTDELIPAVSRFPSIAGVNVWSTDQMPVDNSPAADAAQRAGFVKPILPNYGPTVRVTVPRLNAIL